jgi:hypothetical protein
MNQMKCLTYIALGLLVVAGCAESDEYEVNKPVLTEPVPHTPVVTPEADSDLDVDIDNDAIDDATAPNDAVPNSATPGASGTAPVTSGAIENDTLDEEDESTNP